MVCKGVEMKSRSHLVMLKGSLWSISLGLSYRYLSLMFWTSCRVSELQGQEVVVMSKVQPYWKPVISASISMCQQLPGGLWLWSGLSEQMQALLRPGILTGVPWAAL